jgi:DNA polymerase-3 subunit alpha
MKELHSYLTNQRIIFEPISEETLKIGEHIIYLVQPDDENFLFNKSFQLLVEDQECDFYAFNFGGQWYYTDNPDKPQLTPLKYIGKSECDSMPFLGIHGKYDILSGSRSYKDWCKKAKWMGVETLGICEKNTLSGTLSFQMECVKNGIKPILGATYTVDRKDFKYDIKCYAKNKEGWSNLLAINKEVKIENGGFIKEVDLFKLLGGLYIVLDPKSLDFDQLFPLNLSDLNLFYQLDSVEFTSNDKDKWYLENMKKYLFSDIPPVFIVDAYYLDKEDAHIKKTLNSISNKFEYESSNQHFKDFSEYLEELNPLFGEDTFFENKISQAVSNLLKIEKNCNFAIDTKSKHLPKYQMTKEEKIKFKTNEDLFWSLIEEGLREKGLPGRESEEFERIEKEVEIINYGNLQDYFLINWDQTKFCHSNDIVAGVGRGSSLGFLTSYCLDITKIHPFKYDLIAERFLTKERALNKIADIDGDVMQAKRGDVKQYLENKYGFDQCCSVGSYSTLQIKGAFKDLAKLANIEFGTANRISMILGECESFTDIFAIAANRKELKNFIQKHLNLFNTLRYVLGAIKSQSIHPSAFIITPKDKKVWEWMPIRKEVHDGEVILVSEWEGYDLEDAGFLKQDILGLKQLDKFKGIIDSVKEHVGDDIDIYNLPLDDQNVFKYFSNGWNQDVFQFGTQGLISYCKFLKPETINDLIAAVALFRPGTMENNFHNEYVLRRNGEKEIECYSGTEEILKDTYGLMVYQENIMFICQKLAGFDLSMTDEIRRALGKKKLDVLMEYKKKFLDGAIKNGYEEGEMSELWSAMEKFAGYSFNLSHAAAYATTGYISQWLKVNYPIHFWTVAFSFAREEHISSYISEINHTGDISISPPDINISGNNFTTNFENKSIAWSLSAIKQVGEKAVEQILSDREEKGEYFSFEEFYTRHKFTGSKVNKAVIENLIVCGAFDKIENIEDEVSRQVLIKQYRALAKTKIVGSDWFNDNKDFYNQRWWWVLQQKKLCGFAFFDYNNLLELAIESDKFIYVDEQHFFEEEMVNDKVKAKIGGYVNEVNVKNSKRGEFCQMTIEMNYEFINVTIWPEEWEVLKDLILESEKKIILITGDIVYDKFRKTNSLQSTDKTEVLILE